jgi:hypothetical protein
MAFLAQRGGRIEQGLERLLGREQPADRRGVAGAGDPDRLGGRDHHGPAGRGA